MKRAIAWGMISCALCAVVCWFYLQKTTDTKQVEPIEMEIQFTQLPSEATDYDAQTIVRVQREDSEEQMIDLHKHCTTILLVFCWPRFRRALNRKHSKHRPSRPEPIP